MREFMVFSVNGRLLGYVTAKNHRQAMEAACRRWGGDVVDSVRAVGE
jgi:hypothetical protein